MDHHIDHHFDDALDALKKRILFMGGVVDAMVADATRALTERNADLARAIVARDREVDALEVAIDEQCLALLARYQPAASDLRFVTRGLKIVTDLERIADLAVNTAQRVIEIVREGDPPVDLGEMAGIVQGMLRDALDAFVRGDVAKAEAVLGKDDAVDALTERYVTELMERSMVKPHNLRRYFPATSIVRYLERIADHATNIAEIAIFMAKGRDVRHGGAH